MAASETNLGTGGRAKRRKKTPEEIAEERIEAARKSKETILNLSGLGLTELPASIGQLAQLQTLCLDDGQLTALPEALGRLTQLRRFSVANNRLTTLPEAIGQLVQLQSLQVSKNRLTALPEAIGQLVQLTDLGVSNNRLTALPETIGQLAPLWNLEISDNQLTVLPETVLRLGRLSNLFVGGNQLTVLPETIGQMAGLSMFDIPNNRLTALPETIGQLAELQWLNLGSNHLAALPEGLRRLKQLTSLFLHNNPALGLPPKVLGPTLVEIWSTHAEPGSPASILDYYFKTREAAGREAVRVAFSYSHKDEELRDQLETHLKLLQRQGVISTWHDRKILGGENWAGVIDDNFKRADLILLLVSADFVASDYCYETEMKMALEREAKGEACVVPVILRACDWKAAPFGKLQGFPKDVKPVTSWRNRAEAWTDVAAGIRKVAEEIRTQRR